MDDKFYWLIIPCITLLLLGLTFEISWIYGSKEFQITIKTDMNNNTLEAVRLACLVQCCNIKGISSIDNHTYYDTNKTCYYKCLTPLIK